MSNAFKMISVVFCLTFNQSVMALGLRVVLCGRYSLCVGQRTSVSMTIPSATISSQLRLLTVLSSRCLETYHDVLGLAVPTETPDLATAI